MNWPERWVTFDNAAEDCTGGHKKILKRDYLDEGNIPVIDQGQNTPAGYTNDKSARIADNLPVVLFGDHTRSLKYIDFPFAIGADGVKILSAKSQFLPRYLYHFWKSQRIENKGYSRHFKLLKRIKLPLVSIPEQRRIIEILDQADALRKKRAEADEMMLRLLPAMFYKMFGNPQTNEKKWDVKALGDPSVSRINPRFRKDILKDDVEVSFIPMADVDEVWGKITGTQTRLYSQVRKGYTAFSENDILFAKITPCMQNGKSAIAKNLCNGFGFGSTEFHVLRPNKLSTPDWLYGLVRLPMFRDMAKGSFTGSAGQQRVPTEFLKSFRVPIPPLPVQQSFASVLLRLVSYSNRAGSSVEEIENLYLTLLHRAFSGELTAQWREAHMKEILQEIEHQSQRQETEENPELDPAIQLPESPNPILENKATILAYIVHKSQGARHHMARVKLAKQYYFVNQLMNQPVTDDFTPQAAGPLDNDIYPAMAIAQQHKWIIIEPQKGKEKPITPGVCISDSEKKAAILFGKAKQRIDEYLEKTKNWGWETLERWATVHSASMKLIEGNYPVSLAWIKSRIRTIPEWEAKLKRGEFSDENIEKAIKGLRRMGLLPETRRDL